MNGKIGIVVIVLGLAIAGVLFFIHSQTEPVASEIPVLEDGFGIYTSEVTFNGVYPGWSGSFNLTILNGKDKARTFRLTVASPSKVKEGYEPFPEENFGWIDITLPEVDILPGTHCAIPITLSMPENSEYRGKRAEVRINVGDMTQTGLVQIAMEARWYIITAE